MKRTLRAFFFTFFIVPVMYSVSLSWVLCLVFAIAPNAGAQTQKPLIAVIPPDFPPTYFRDPVSGKPAGLAVDLTNELARRAGLQVEYRFGEPWEHIEQELLSGKADLIPLRVMNDKTLERFIFTQQLDATPVNYIVRASDRTTRAPSPGQKVGFIRGSTAAVHLKGQPDVILAPYDSMQHLFMDLITGQIDLVLTVPANTLKLAKEANLDNRVRVIEPPVFEVTRGIALSRANTALRDRLNRAIESLEGTPAQREIYQRWLAKPQPWWTEKRLAWIMGTCLAGLTILLLIYHYVGMRRLNRRLEAESALLQTMIDAIPEPIVYKDRESVYLGCNDFFIRNVIGLPKEQIIGRTDFDFFKDRRLAEFFRQKDRETLAAGKLCSYDVWLPLADGRSILAETLKVPFHSAAGEIAGLISIARDVTARRRDERLQAEVRERLQMILDNLPMMAWLKDGRGHYEMVNSKFAKSLRLQVSEVIGKTDLELWPLNALIFQAEDNQVIESRRQQQFETRLTLGSQSHCFLVFKTPILDGQGEVTGTTGIALDITARQHAAEEVRAVRDRLELALQGGDLGTWDWNVQTGEVIFNDRWAAMLGYALAEIDPHARSWENLVHPDDLPGVMEALTAHLKGKTPFYETEHRLLHKTGKWVWVLDKGKVIERDAQGQALRACGTHLDITARKEAEAALRESEAKYRRLMETANDAIFIADMTTGIIIDANHKAAELTGLPVDEIIGRHQSQLHSPAEKERYEELFRQHCCGHGGIFSEAMYVIHTDGRSIPVEISSSLTELGGRPVVQGIFRDITERQEAGQSLEKSLSLLHATLESSADGLLVVDRQGRIASYNQKFAQMWDIPESVLALGEDNQALAFILGQLKSPEAFMARVQELYGDPEAESHDRIEFKDGRIFDRFSQPQRLGDAAVGRVWIFRDITDQLQAEAALKETELRFRNLLEYIPGIAIQGYGDDGIVRYWNKASEKTYGYSAEEAIGNNLGDLIIPPELKPHFVRALELGGMARESGEFMPPGELMLLHKNGSLVPVYSIHTVVCLEGMKPLMFCIDVDLSDRKRAEEALRQEHAFRASLIERAAEGICVCHAIPDPPFVAFTVWNNRMQDLTGYSMEEINQKGWYQAMYPDPEVQRHAIERMAAMRQGEDLQADEWVITRADGEKRTVCISTSILPSPDRSVHVLALIDDVTLRKQAEKQIKDSLAEKEVLLREIHHRVKNNLMIVLGLLNSRIGSIKDPQVKEILQDCQTRIRAMSLVHESLYRSDNLAKINLQEYLRSLGHTIMASYGLKRNIQFICEVEPLQTNLDTAIPCGLILTELVSNALKHAFPDGQAGEILLSLRKNPAGEMVLTVRDNGVGIGAPIDLNSADSLGLRLVNDLVRYQLGGAIVLKNDQGTEFEISFKELHVNRGHIV